MTRQNCLGILWRNPHHRIRRIDVTVTQCSHDDVADAPMIDAGDLLIRNRYAAASCGQRRIGPFWHQLRPRTIMNFLHERRIVTAEMPGAADAQAGAP